MNREDVFWMSQFHLWTEYQILVNNFFQKKTSEQETYSFFPWRANVLHMKSNVLPTSNLSWGIMKILINY